MREFEERVLARRREYAILRVDRADLSKNVLRGFTAFDIFLEQHPEFAERITFTAQLMPSRTDVPEYAEYLEKIEALVAVVNHRHGTPDWMPIDLKLRDDLDEAVASYKHYDVMMVNAMFDGMNLVAKEGPLVNERHGVSILTENTGAHEELGEFALSVNPFDVQELADAIYSALMMSPEARERRARGLKEIVTSRDPGDWIDEQIADIRAKAGAPSPPPAASASPRIRTPSVPATRSCGAGGRRRGAGGAGRGRRGRCRGVGRRDARGHGARRRGRRRHAALRRRDRRRHALAPPRVAATRLLAAARVALAARPSPRPRRFSPRPPRLAAPSRRSLAAPPRSRRARRSPRRRLAAPLLAAAPPRRAALARPAARLARLAPASPRRAPRRRPSSAPPRCPPRRRGPPGALPAGSPSTSAGRAASAGSRGGGVAVRGQAMTVASVGERAEGQRHVGPSHPSQHVAPHTPRRCAVGWVRPTLLPSAAAMASGQHIYDLTLLLDPAVEAERREQIVADIADLIDRTGEFIGRHDWGTRQTAFEVRKKAEADYHLIQFRGANELLEQLDHNLKITDGVLRHRIIKLRPGTPDPPDLRPSATAVAEPVRRRGVVLWTRPTPSSAFARRGWPEIPPPSSAPGHSASTTTTPASRRTTSRASNPTRARRSNGTSAPSRTPGAPDPEQRPGLHALAAPEPRQVLRGHRRPRARRRVLPRR